MKKVKLYEDFISEANKGKVHRAAKKGSYPAVVVVVQDGKVIHQEPVSTPDVAPATFNVMQEKYPKALIHLEDNTGKRLFSESIVTEEKDDRSHIILLVASRNYESMIDKLQDMHINHRRESKTTIKVYTDKTSGWYGNSRAQYKLTHDVWVDKFVIKESIVTEGYNGDMSDFKYEFPMRFEEETGNSPKTIKKMAKQGNGYEVRTSTHMSQAEMEKVGLALGLNLKSYTKDGRVAISVYESVVTEGNIKYKKGKTYQSEGPWTVVVDSNSSGLDISVNNSAGWRLDPQDEREETFQLLDGGRQRATLTFKEGNIDAFAKKMFDLNDRTTHGEKEGLTAKDYADIIRVWIDMRMANEAIVTEAGQEAYKLHRLADNPGESVADEFLSKHNVDFKLLTKAIQQGTINKYELRDIVNGSAHALNMKRFIKDFVTESL